jgi:hypothetical protein
LKFQYLVKNGTIYFINVYTKNEKDDLTEAEKKAFKTVVNLLKEE